MPYDPISAFPLLASLGIFAYLVLGLVIIWTIVIKGFALWKAARNSHKAWFIIVLIVNSLGILELIYLIWFSKPRSISAPAPVSSAPEA